MLLTELDCEVPIYSPTTTVFRGPVSNRQVVAVDMRHRATLILPLWLTTAMGQYVKLPQAQPESRWSTPLSRVERRTGNSSVWPYGPFSTKGRDIVNTREEVITWAGVNWPLSLETMVPEGLEWISAEEILDNVASVGFNFVRM